MACLECRRRRIRCDGGRPKCQHCTRLSKTCEYVEYEKRRGPKKLSVKELEERLVSLEAQIIASQNGYRSDISPSSSEMLGGQEDSLRQEPSQTPMPWSPPDVFDFNIDFPMGLDEDLLSEAVTLPPPVQPAQSVGKANSPTTEETEELYQIYFDDVHPCMPFLSPHKFTSDLFSPLRQEPLPCLKYAIWSLAASRSPKYADRATSYYQSARAQLDHDEMQDDGSGIATLEHLQAWLLVVTFESEAAVPARAWMSNRRANALSSMLGLHRIDGPEAGSFRMLKPPNGPAELEERRRAFWYLFVCDRWASSGIGKSVFTREDEIFTNLPAGEDVDSPTASRPQRTIAEIAASGFDPSASSLIASVLTARMLERIMEHLRKTKRGTIDADFWLRHERLDNEIARLLLSMPDHLRPATTRDPNGFFVNMCLHEFAISIFTTALTAAQDLPDKSDMRPFFQLRTRRAAEEMINIMKMQIHLSIRKMSAWTPACLYVAASVYIRDIKQGHNVARAKEILRFVLQTSQAFGRLYRNGQMFLAQLLIVMEKNHIEIEALNLEGNPLSEALRLNCDFEFMGPIWSAAEHLRTT